MLTGRRQRLMERVCKRDRPMDCRVKPGKDDLKKTRHSSYFQNVCSYVQKATSRAVVSTALKLSIKRYRSIGSLW